MLKIVDKFLTSSHSHKFRLFKSLMTGSLIGLVITGGSFVWLNFVNLNQKSNLQTDLVDDVNRAAEFIQEEVKSASKIESDAVSAVASISGFTLPTGATPVLVLKTSEGNDVVYYTQPTSSPWMGPSGIYRWGHSFDEDGNYDTTQSPNSHILLDNIDNTSNSVICPSGWQSSTTNPINGFYACIQGDNLAEFNINAVASPVASGDSLYSVKTAALARSDS